MDNLAPIALFVYNRLEHTKLTIEALKKNKLAEASDLYIFSDGPKNRNEEEKVNDIRKYINSVSGFNNVQIFESSVNKGLGNSIIEGVTSLINKFSKIIVLEDDLVTSRNFILYMNFTLDLFENNNSIWAISGYNLPIKIPKTYNEEIYLSYRPTSWGWATWQNRWKKCDWDIKDFNELRANKKRRRLFNRGGPDLYNMLKSQMNGEIDSWAIRWAYNQFNFNCFSIYPTVSKIQNFGIDGSGTHKVKSNRYKVILDSRIEIGEIDSKIVLNNNIVKEFRKHFSPQTMKSKLVFVLQAFGLFKYVKMLKMKLNYKLEK